jgi:hypothetical protein
MRNDRLKWLREMREARIEGKGEAVTKPPVTKPSAPTKLNKPAVRAAVGRGGKPSRGLCKTAWPTAAERWARCGGRAFIA